MELVFFSVLLILGILGSFVKPKQKEIRKYEDMTDVERFYVDGTKLAAFLILKNDYLGSDLWQRKRKELFALYDSSCQLCGRTGRLEAHHMQDYVLIPNEPISSLACLCRDCHEAQHQHYGFPKTYQDYRDWNTPLYKGNT